jgi:hypothetical protein
MKKHNLFAVILLILSACAPKNANNVEFNQPQPEGVKNLKEFPSSYRGKYIDNDSNILVVDKSLMILNTVYTFKIAKQEADTSKEFHIENQYLVFSHTNEKLPFTLKADTLYVKQCNSDTIYNLSKDIIRKYKGYLILNKEYNDLWDVEIASRKSGEIKMRNFSSDNLFEKLTKLSNAQVVTDQTKKILIKQYLKPTRKQFEAILNFKDSLSSNTYKKIK